jgi:hypothetical protein
MEALFKRFKKRKEKIDRMYQATRYDDGIEAKYWSTKLYSPLYASSNTAISNFFMLMKAFCTREICSVVPSRMNFSNEEGTTCHGTPNLSVSHPH